MSDPKIVSLNSAAEIMQKIANGEPDQELIEFMRDMLADAESGKMQAVSIVATDGKDGFVAKTVGRVQLHSMLGGIAILKHKLLNIYGNAV